MRKKIKVSPSKGRAPLLTQMSSSASFSRLFSADSWPKKSRWIMKERLLIALSDLAKLWAIESVHRPFLRRAKIAHLTRCQTEKAKDSFYSPYYNEASSMCMAHPIWSRDGRISTTDFTMRREIFFSPRRSKKKSVWDYKLCSTCSSQSSVGRAVEQHFEMKKFRLFVFSRPRRRATTTMTFVSRKNSSNYASV